MARSKTAGERIAKWHANKHSAWGVPMIGDVSLAARIDRAIRDARNELFLSLFNLQSTTGSGETKGKNFKPAKKTKGAK